MIQDYSAQSLELNLILERALRAVTVLRDEALKMEEKYASDLARIQPAYRESARNLIHYLSVRNHDIRALQQDLSVLGLSSLGRTEAHVMASLESVLLALQGLTGRSIFDLSAQQFQPVLAHRLGDALLTEHAETMMGALPEGRRVRIMVTMPAEAAQDPALARDLLAKGMNIARINCAHDHTGVWQRMVDNIRQAERELLKPCLIAFDLGGPKLRTGPIRPGPEVVKWRPKRDEFGRTVSPAVVIFSTMQEMAEGVVMAGNPAGETVLPISEGLPAIARPGDELRLVDARGRKRTLMVVDVTADRLICRCDRTGYAVSGMDIGLFRQGEWVAGDTVGRLPAKEKALTLADGDMLIVVPAGEEGRDAVHDEQGRLVEPARIGCTLSQVFQDVRVGHRIFLDDGKFSGMVRETGRDWFRVEILRAGSGSARLRAEKGINLPDTELNLPALSEKDIADLDFAARHGDMVSLSFVQRSEDISRLFAEMDRVQGNHLGVILKIEGQNAFHRLPRLLLTALRKPPVAVMVARGDLGVEVGFERLAEVQEEILWLCEAAHVPTIWATQVLESLAKNGIPSRAEVTDAAMGVRAECVMLNKGPYILEAVAFLDDVLRRMQDHQDKKSARLRKLTVSTRFM